MRSCASAGSTAPAKDIAADATWACAPSPCTRTPCPRADITRGGEVHAHRREPSRISQLVGDGLDYDRPPREHRHVKREHRRDM
mmetsp:Transcript_1222/g.3826  ORF Transcript_1222/g.3826 Transcript_1222/m.3826 type:complete len:84 (-) Transcript_1222:70-321(-)